MYHNPEFSGRVPSGSATLAPHTFDNPYAGPKPFDRTRKLYGRDHETATVLNLIRAERIVLIHAVSGAGKTSLMQSAVAPVLEQEGYDVLPTVRVGLGATAVSRPELAPGNRYLASALLSLTQAFPASGEERLPAETLRQCLDSLRALRPQSGGDTMQLLIFDQFEEVLSLDPADTSQKREFFAELALTLRDDRVAAVFLLREEYLSELEQYAALLPTRLSRRFRLERLTKEQAIPAIRCPAESQGVNFTSAAARHLIETLAQESTVAADGTVVERSIDHIEGVQLQLACFDIWERKRREWLASPERTPTIEPADVSASGTVETALSGYYAAQMSETAASLGIPEEELRDWVATRLISPGGLRSQVLDEGSVVGGLSAAAVHALEQGLLVRREYHGGRTWYELSHDRFLGPIRSDNKRWFRENANWLRRAAEAWQSNRKRRDLLSFWEIRRARVEQKRRGLSPVEQAFVQASQKKISIVEVIAAGAILGLVAAFYGVYMWGSTVAISDYRWLARQHLDLQSELQARTYSEIPIETVPESEIPWRGGVRRTGVPSIAPSPRFGVAERAAERRLAQEQLRGLATTSRPLAGIPVRLQGTSLGASARERLSGLGAVVHGQPQTTEPPNSLTIHPSVSVEAVRVLALALAAEGTPISRIRKFRSENPPSGAVLEHVPEVEVWAPLTVNQILELDPS